MENKQWLELINGNVDEIIEAGEQAFKDSVDNKHLEYIVELYKDGSINVWHSCGNSCSGANYRGDSIVVMKFDNQNLEIVIETEDYVAKATEKGINVPTTDDDGDYLTSQELFEWLYENHREVIRECDNEWLEWYKNEYAYQEASDKLEAVIDEMRMDY